MRERLTTLACALGALLLFGTLFLRSDTLAERRALPPTTLERGANGLLGVASWLKAEGVRTLSLRERFSSLQQHRELPARGNLLLVSLPAVTNFRSDEQLSLDRWIREGNTLLVLAALRDRPAWAQFPFVMSNDLQQLTGLAMVPEADRPGRARARPRLTTELASAQRSELRPNRAHAYFAGVTRAVAFSDYAPIGNTVRTPHDGFALSLARESGSGQDAFWIRPDGDGTVIVSAFGSLFSNRALGVADNARLLANLIGASVARDGAVVFDDEHQGLTAAYDPARFYGDPRLHATLAVIAAVWLIWVLGATQLQLPPGRSSAPREAELVRTSGLFLARVLRPAAAARRMVEQFLKRAGSAAARDPSQEGPLWEWLESHPRLRRAQVGQLREWHAAARAGRRVPLLRLHNLIVRTERQLGR